MIVRLKKPLAILLALIVLAAGLYQIPAIHSRLAWRLDVSRTYLKNWIHPPGPPPTPLPVTAAARGNTPVISPTPRLVNAVTATSTPLPLPPRVALPSPAWEKQTPNNCGPATLSMALHMYGWEGNQEDIAKVIKPVLQDRNVNPEEMAYYVRNYAGWLNIEFRVAGDLPLLKRLLAAGYPVIIEGVTRLDPNDALGPNDDLWAAHYLLLTGYDDVTQTFTVQDSYHGADLSISYSQLTAEWEPFNNLYMVIYLSQDQQEMETLLGPDWDADQNRQRALENAQAATKNDPNDAFAWFNLGSDLVYFERYEEAALAYDQARRLGLPLRMFRYQFGPFIAYFQSNRIDDLLALTDYARGITDMSEETWLWYGWGLYRKNDFAAARKAWEKALSIHPGYADAEYALNFLKSP